MKIKKYQGFKALRTGQKKKKSIDVTRHWFKSSKKFYQAGQPFQTFVRKASFRQQEMLEKKIRKIVPELEKRAALEIGPGQEPLISKLDFKKIVFLDLSKAIADKLKASIRQSEIIVGDIRKLPPTITKTKERFGTIVINEVLTHLIPSERIKAIQNMLNLTDSILIIDRKQQSLGEIISASRKKGLKILRNFTGKNSIKTTLSRKKIHESSNINARKARQIQLMQVNFKFIKSFFERNGWEITIKDIESNKIVYTVFTAKRK